jgi:hypothetical protein
LISIFSHLPLLQRMLSRFVGSITVLMIENDTYFFLITRTMKAVMYKIDPAPTMSIPILS